LKEGTYTVKKLTRHYVKAGVIAEESDELYEILKSREYYLENLAKLSEERKRLENPHTYKVDLSTDLLELKYSLIKKIKSTLN
ncbi:MAG: nicotinate phosphoribosyltransferase, partial [Fusobacteriaceae bacterium]